MVAVPTDEEFGIFVKTVKGYAIFLLDTEGHVARWNIGAEPLKGYKAEEIVGKHFFLFYGDEVESNKPQKGLEVSIHQGRMEAEDWRYRKDGSRFRYNAIITSIYKNRVHMGFGKVTRDLTEQKTAESHLIEAYEDSSMLKSVFLADMSHEIRTPMHRMLSACALLLDTPLTDDQRECSDMIDESSKAQEAGLPFYGYVILSSILRNTRKRYVFANLFWALMVAIVVVYIMIATTRIRNIVGNDSDSGLQYTNRSHVAYFLLIVSTKNSLNQTGWFLMRSTEVRLALLAIVGTMRAVTYSFQVSAQSATSVGGQIYRFCCMMEGLFPVILV
ncbi:hypothetical protein NEMBOFW57_006225 [Staphylotrichum longicolle]|uniref:PAS domain-containing protein n=1 Tax=Staphylotrichum longicolle TaxID=669026 RepID=A0AAD4I2E9_9PEZI|nr:hypothetical protein NEMBOFW57_006225 [Staphylotrichum longicolle]